MEVAHPPQSHSAKLIESSSLEDLNDDLVIEILCRLPYKDVVRCKCVSRNWFSLICNPQFVRRFSSVNKLPWTFLYFAARYYEVEKEDLLKVTSNDIVFKSPGFSLEFLPCYNPEQRYFPISIFKTYNDLVLCCESKDELSKQYYICNPLTMQWVSLPPTPPSHRYASVDFICEYDQKKHHQCRFTVVRVPKEQGTKEIKVEIFSTEISQWNEISVSVSIPDDFDSLLVDEALICKEKLIILGYVKDSRGMCCTMNINMIIFYIFNGGASSINHIFKMSKDFNTSYPFSGLYTMSQGGLRLARVFKLKSRPVIKIWELGEESNYEWRLMQEANLKDAASECEWVSEDYLKRTFLTWMQIEDWDAVLEEGFAVVPNIVQFDPHDVNILYLDLHCGGRMGKYDIQRGSLNIVNHISLTSRVGHVVGNPYLVVLQLWPTPLPPQLASHS